MMDEVIIRVDNLSKTFKLYKSPRHRLLEAIHPLRKRYHNDFQALNDVSFEIRKGESIGILGRNGAGKSTLLKILTGVQSPTSGKVKVKGRIAALLELGAGFNPSLSGMENIFFQGAIMGFTKEDMDSKIKEIIDFAEIGEYINQPVKTYSSGMFARLAFSIVVNVEPEIMIVDEALSVGDIRFQAKCLVHLRKMMSRGVTLLFVSHDTAMVKGLCNRSITLANGRLIDIGLTSEVADRYIGASHLEINKLLTVESNSQSIKANHPTSIIKNNKKETGFSVSIDDEVSWPKSVHRYGDGTARVLDVKFLNKAGSVIDSIEVDSDYTIQVSIKFLKSFADTVIGYSFRDLKGQQLIGSLSEAFSVENPGDVVVFDIIGTNKLREGAYTISIGVESPVVLNQHHIFLDVLENVLAFKSVFKPDSTTWFPSMIKMPAAFNMKQVLTGEVRE